MLFDTFVNRVLTFVPAPLTAATQMIEMRPASSAYSMRSWPCSSQINERMKFFIMYSSPFNVLLGWLLLTTLAVTVNQQVDGHECFTRRIGRNVPDSSFSSRFQIWPPALPVWLSAPRGTFVPRWRLFRPSAPFQRAGLA